MRFFLRVLVVFAIVMAAISALRGLFAPTTSRSAKHASDADGRTGKLLKDPVCGTYVTEGALKTTRASKTFYFCSEECRDEFLAAEG